MYFFYFYPVATDQQTRRRPLLSFALMAVMIGTFLWYRYFPGLLPLHPAELIFFPGHGSPWTVVTALFLHADWLHLLGNLVYIQAFGPVLEDRLGHARFLLYFLILGVFGNLAHGVAAATGWLGAAGVGVLGASGAIAGLLSFCLVRLPGAGVTIAWWLFAPLMGQNRAGKTRVPVIAAVGFWLMLQVVQSLVATETGALVSYGAHLGGFAMGLLLALAMGQRHEGRADAKRQAAQDYFRDGAYYASAGAWTEYIELHPEDLDARLELARAQTLSGQSGPARANYQRVFKHLLERKDVAGALEVFSEAGRNGASQTFLTPDELNLVAYYREKQLDHAGAADVYSQIHASFPDTVTGQRALVRAITLLDGAVGDRERAQELFELACREMPPGRWRDYLEAEFKDRAAPCAVGGADRPGRSGESGS